MKNNPPFLLVLVFTLFVGFLPAQTIDTWGSEGNAVLDLTPFKVKGARINESDAAGPSPIDNFSSSDIEGSGAFDVGEFLGQLPPSPVGKEQLVLVDGKPTYLNPATLPPDMIESIEVSPYGSLPQYGARANGRVVNIKLKKNYNSSNLSLDFRDSFAGGGGQQAMMLSGGLTKGKLRSFYSFNYSHQTQLLASDRAFSRNQDHTAQGGSDLRLPWGELAVVQSVAGSLNGVVDNLGQPTAVALAPGNPTNRALAPADFLPAQVVPPLDAAQASGQRRFNTADYLALLSPSSQAGFNLGFNYALTDKIELGTTASFYDSRSDRDSAPPVTPASAATVVPAAYSPFGQDVEVGLVHVGFGPVRQSSKSTNAQAGFSLNGQIGRTWHWSSGLGYTWSTSGNRAIDLDVDKFSAALAAADPAQRFNPFGDPAVNLALYAKLAVERTTASASTSSNLNLSSNGDLGEGPGGPMKIFLRGTANEQEQTRQSTHAVGIADATVRERSGGYQLSSTVTVPWVKKPLAGLRRVETELTGDYYGSSTSGSTESVRLGLLWVPLKPLLFQVNYASSWVPPLHFVAGIQPVVAETFSDPQRFPATAEDVKVTSHDFDGTRSGRTEQQTVSANFEPPPLKGLQLSVTYDQQVQHNLATAFNAQDLINNEAAFAARVIRATPSAQDIALHQPGAILSLDTTPGDGAEFQSSGLNFSLEYRLPWQTFGQFRISTNARHPLTSRYEAQPGVPFFSATESFFNPPDWTVQSQVAWNKGSWNVSTHFRYSEAVPNGSLTIPGATDVDVQLGYKFTRAVARNWGKGMHVAVGLGNLFQGPPAFADTINGFRSGSALGRTYSCRLSLPL